MFLFNFLKLILSTTYDYPCQKSDSCNNLEVTLEKGIYQFECWGAQGGTGTSEGSFKLPGGHGSYVSGLININQTTKFYLFIGGKGGVGSTTKNSKASAGWNGGGLGGADTNDNDGAGGGGGATDIRLTNGLWNDITGLRSRIMVAAGGSGSVHKYHGVSGGSLSGLSTTGVSFESAISSTRTTQTTGNGFGIAGDGKHHANFPSYGGGGGYYGGYAASGSNNGYLSVSDSGSSYISGHPSCNSISNTGIHTNSEVHFSGYKFYNTTMINGISLQPSYNSNNFNFGKTNNGAVRITFIKKFENIEITPSKKFKIFDILFLSILIL